MKSEEMIQISSELSLQGSASKAIVPVSLICTVYNEADNILEFLDSMIKQSCDPAEVVIVDGGSTDGTAERIKKYIAATITQSRIRFIIDPTCNLRFTKGPIAKGRNIAIQNASNEIIACTDAGCLLDKYWLERITLPLLNDKDVDVVGGWYLADARSFVERCIAIAFLLPPTAVDENNMMPSSRSVAFRKTAWNNIGGYPEVSFTAEDTAFIKNMRAAHYTFRYVRDAVVFWRMKSSFTSFFRLIYSYGFGDGATAIVPGNLYRNFVKLGIPIALIVCSVLITPWALLILGVYWWLLPFNNRINDAFVIKNILKVPMISFLKVSADISYVAGYLGGMRSDRSPGTK